MQLGCTYEGGIGSCDAKRRARNTEQQLFIAAASPRVVRIQKAMRDTRLHHMMDESRDGERFLAVRMASFRGVLAGWLCATSDTKKGH
jgi:hypothetical protein